MVEVNPEEQLKIEEEKRRKEKKSKAIEAPLKKHGQLFKKLAKM